MREERRRMERKRKMNREREREEGLLFTVLLLSFHPFLSLFLSSYIQLAGSDLAPFVQKEEELRGQMEREKERSERIY